MSGELKNLSIKEEAWQLCKEFLAGPWKAVSLEEFRLFEVRGGLSNTLYRCALPENTTNDTTISSPKEILLRIYGPIQDDPTVLVSEVVIFMMLSERKLGPKLYGVFPKGRLEEFIPSHSLSSDEMRTYSPYIAREMAKIHALTFPIRKVPDFFPTYMNKWLTECKEAITKDKNNDFLTFHEYKKEAEWLTQEMERTGSPVVYCHNDLQGGNVLFREDSTKNGKPNIMLIDFEFGAYNYRNFDIANHLCEWCMDYDTPDYPHFQIDLDKFPTREEQMEFCLEYLGQLRSEGVTLKKSLKEEAEDIVKDMYLFVAAAHLIWSLWSIRFCLINEDFGHVIPDQKSASENNENTTVLPPTDDCHWKERLESTIKAALKEHSKTRKGLFEKFKSMHLDLSLQK